MSTHVFDEAVRLHPLADDGRQRGHTHPGYQNMVGPYGGITAAVLMQAVLNHPRLLGEPIAITVNFAGPVAEGPFIVDAQPVRTNNTTQHWVVTQTPAEADGLPRAGPPSTTATVVTAARRRTWSASDAPLPEGPGPAACAPSDRGAQAGAPAWLSRYEMRPITGALPVAWDEQEAEPLTRMWVRDTPPRPLDFASLTALADTFFPLVWLRRARRTAVGTVSMSVYFHADTPQLAASGTQYLLAQARGQAFRHGFFDHSGQLWNEQGMLLATTHQIVYYKD